LDPASHIFSTSLGLTGWFSEEEERKGLFFPAIIGSLAPDLDILSIFGGIGCYAHYHQAITHTFWAAPALVFIVAYLFYLWRPYKNLWGLLAVGTLGITLHILEDLTIDWGMAFFWPFSNETYTLRVIFLTDPFFLGACIGGTYFNLRSSVSPAFKKRLSLAILILFTVYFLGRYFLGAASSIFLRSL